MTKTAEEIVISIIHKQQRSCGLKESEFHDGDKEMIQVMFECMEEYASHLKKRIEELEANADEIERRYRMILSEPTGEVRETMIYNLLTI